MCPLSVSVSWPEPASQTFTVSSSQLAEAMRRPSGLNATPVTTPVCPLSVSVSCPEPASQTLTVSIAAGGGDAASVGAERHAI